MMGPLDAACKLLIAAIMVAEVDNESRFHFNVYSK